MKCIVRHVRNVWMRWHIQPERLQYEPDRHGRNEQLGKDGFGVLHAVTLNSYADSESDALLVAVKLVKEHVGKDVSPAIHLLREVLL